MALSTRTYQRERMWVSLLRHLPEGVNDLPQKMELMPYQALMNTCVRLNNFYKTGEKSGISLFRDNILLHLSGGSGQAILLFQGFLR